MVETGPYTPLCLSVCPTLDDDLNDVEPELYNLLDLSSWLSKTVSDPAAYKLVPAGIVQLDLNRFTSGIELDPKAAQVAAEHLAEAEEEKSMLENFDGTDAEKAFAAGYLAQKYKYNYNSASRKFEFNAASSAIGELFLKHFLTGERGDPMSDTVLEFSKSICGIILGIFDFDRMDSSEVYDTLIPIVKLEDSFYVMCRGELMRISVDDSMTQQLSDTLIVSPYLLIPNAVLIYNEHVLNKISSMLDDDGSLTNVDRLENTRVQINEMLNLHYMDELFQYPNEQEVIREGTLQRGLDGLMETTHKRIAALSEAISNTRSMRTNRSDALLNALLSIIAAFQLADTMVGKESLTFKDILSLGISLLFAVLVYMVVRQKTISRR